MTYSSFIQHSSRNHRFPDAGAKHGRENVTRLIVLTADDRNEGRRTLESDLRTRIDMMSCRKEFRVKRHVLVASASNAITERIAKYFSHHGYCVSTAQGGVDCVSQIERTPPDVLILDWDLPWGGGAGVLASLRDSDATNKIPMVLLHQEFSSEPIVSTHFARCLQLPCDVKSVYLAVDSLLTSINHQTNRTITSEMQHQRQPAHS